MKKKNTDATKVISYSASRIDGLYHRVSLTHCPHCDHNEEFLSWFQRAHTLVCAEVHGKHSSIAMITECAKCFEHSWAHWDLTSMRNIDFPGEWVSACEKEYKARNKAAVKRLRESLCLRCCHLDDLGIKTSTRRTCKVGFGQVTAECEYFKEEK